MVAVDATTFGGRSTAGDAVDRGLVEADHRPEGTADEVQLVLDDEVGWQEVEVRVGHGPPTPSSAPTSRFHGIIANLSTVPMTRDGRLE